MIGGENVSRGLYIVPCKFIIGKVASSELDRYYRIISAHCSTYTVTAIDQSASTLKVTMSLFMVTCQFAARLPQ